MSVGFILLRHVNSTVTNLYWQECYTCIRKFYPEHKIIIIDDNSNYAYIHSTLSLQNVEYIQSEFPGRGELLPYIYYLKYHWFDTAFILHDSVFIQHPLPTTIDGYMYMWTFNHKYDASEQERAHISALSNNKSLLEFHKNKNWSGCFGTSSIVSIEFIEKIEQKYNAITILSKNLHTRPDRMLLERIWGLLISIEFNIYNNSLYGEINSHPYAFNENTPYEYFSEACKINTICKTWCGR